MAIVLEHWNCKKCEADRFHVILGPGKFKVAKIAKIICSKCGLIYENRA